MNNNNVLKIAPRRKKKYSDEDEWGDLEQCLYKAYQAAIPDVGLVTDNGVNKRGENDRHCENNNEMKKNMPHNQLIGE